MAIDSPGVLSSILEKLEDRSSVSQLLKVRASWRQRGRKNEFQENACWTRPNLHQEDCAIHLEISTLTADLDIKVYDCGGGKRYFTTQLPYLTGVALCMVVVEAHYATDEHAVAPAGKLHRFLVLQNRIPGAMIMPNVTKVDSMEDPGRRWLERKKRELAPR